MNPVYERDLAYWSLKNPVTIAEAPTWYPIKIYLGNSWRRAHLKVRGDLARHWKNPAKSYRISLDGTEWKGMAEFDLVVPEDKGFELEAVAYEWASLLRIIVPYYEFIDVKLNHKNLGTYFLIERWTDSSFLNRGLEPGEIIAENNAWLNVLDEKTKSLYKNVSVKRDSPNPLSLEPSIYRVNQQRTQSQMAMTKFSKMLEEMKTANVNWEKYIDREASAKWTALLISFGSIHGSFGDNVKWMYSAGTKTFSPILYDVIAYKRNLENVKCLSSAFANANIWIQLWMQDPYMKERITHWYKRIQTDPDMDFQRSWKIIENNFRHSSWNPLQLKMREEIFNKAQENIISGQNFYKKIGCL